ncbi:hypothetical protein T492DRAFT_1009312 [Pavlovales sp. CCMP2436]|nr:hypothetical protein T492DRAFT_1009312 [Pavlovales sp. CCMP2436]
MALFTLALSTLALVRFITPIGPFCPIKSSACRDGGEVSKGMSALAAAGPRVAADLARMQVSAEAGEPVDPRMFRDLADQLDEGVQQWKNSQESLLQGDDFQSLEFYLMSSCHVARSGNSLDDICVGMEWQVQAMRAAADGRPPPPQPDIDFGKDTGFTFQSSPPPLTAQPFVNGAAAFESELIQAEYESIYREHGQLIRMGERFGIFDPRGRLAFLDALEAVEDRWDVFYGRFSLMDAINPEFAQQADEFIRAMGLSGAEDLRLLLREAHQKMRDRAQRELDRGL